ncbi:MAG: transmembrane sensor [Paraglaciecola sp.]|jgi:transmembrane sensor
MKKDDYTLLIYKNLKGELTSNEQKLYTQWLNERTENQNFANEIARNLQMSKRYQLDVKVDIKTEFEPLIQRIRAHKAQENQGGKVIQMKSSRRRWLSIAAAAALLIAVGLWWRIQSFGGEEMVAFSTAAGEKKSVTLADGTLAYLNENSRLSYPLTFENKTRTVKFLGEAYFEVAKNPSKPFIIETTNVKVEVLGTAFNLRAYPEEDKADLLVAEGKVRFSVVNSEKSVTLIANQKGVFDSGNVEKIENSKSNAYAWKSGILSYKDTPLEVVLKDLERLFDVKTDLQNKQLKNCQLTGRFPNAQPKAILAYTAASLKMELVEIKKNEFQLKGGNCE